MNSIDYRGYSCRIDFDADDRVFVGHIAGINDIVGFQANIVADLSAAFHEAVDDDLETCKKTKSARAYPDQAESPDQKG